MGILKYGRILGFDDAAIAAAIDEEHENEELARRGMDVRIGDQVLVSEGGLGPVKGVVLGTGAQGGALIGVGAGHTDAKPEWITRVD